MRQQRQAGVSLVEMMIAMSLGLLVLLGASQAYQALRLSFDRQESLQALQSSLSFTSDTLLHDIRRARQITKDESKDPIEYQLEFSDGSQHRYRLKEVDGDTLLELAKDDDFVLLASGLIHDAPLMESIGEAAQGAWEVSLTFRDGTVERTHTFMAVQRQPDITPVTTNP